MSFIKNSLWHWLNIVQLQLDKEKRYKLQTQKNCTEVYLGIIDVVIYEVYSYNVSKRGSENVFLCIIVYIMELTFLQIFRPLTVIKCSQFWGTVNSLFKESSANFLSNMKGS